MDAIEARLQTNLCQTILEILKKRQAEGVTFDVEINNSAVDIFDEYEGGLRSALTYCVTDNLYDFI